MRAEDESDAVEALHGTLARRHVVAWDGDAAQQVIVRLDDALAHDGRKQVRGGLVEPRERGKAVCGTLRVEVGGAGRRAASDGERHRAHEGGVVEAQRTAVAAVVGDQRRVRMRAENLSDAVEALHGVLARRHVVRWNDIALDVIVCHSDTLGYNDLNYHRIRNLEISCSPSKCCDGSCNA